MSRAEDVARLIELNGGQLIGKTRLQKSAYFLERKEAGFDFNFDYYHFGPYSEELSISTDDAIALGLLDMSWKASQDGARYAIFHSKHSNYNVSDADSRRVAILDILKEYSAVELELAATADFLAHNGFSKDPWLETKRRKSSKFNDDRVSRAKLLLGALNC